MRNIYLELSLGFYFMDVCIWYLYLIFALVGWEVFTFCSSKKSGYQFKSVFFSGVIVGN